MSSGSKRSWQDGNDASSSKRARGRDEPRDWKDVHLKTGADKSRSEYSSRHGDSYRGERREYRDRDRRHGEHKRDRDYRDERERDRHRRSDDRLRNSPRRSSRDRDSSRSRRRRDNPETNVRPRTPDAGSEKEEGEISPRHSRDTSATDNSRPADPPAEVPAPEMELDISTTPPPVEDMLAARRAKRQAILAKYAGVASSAVSVAESVSSSPGPSSAVQQPPPTPNQSDPASQNPSTRATPGPIDVVHKPSNGNASPIDLPSDPSQFSLTKEENVQSAEAETRVAEQVSAADYDPSLDRREDEAKRVWGSGANGDAVSGDIEMIEVEEEEEEDDDDVDDMFAIGPTEKKKKKKTVKKVVEKPSAPALITTTLDSAADPEGYYQIILGEQLDGGRYQVFSSLGKGMFANVVRARILQGDANEVGKEVAIKIVRIQESMYKAGLKEAQILNKLKQADPEDKKHVVRLERTFEHRGHLCLVFESLSMNLRDVVKRFGKDVGLNIRAVRAYAHQLFLAMSLLRKCNIMHADIKPDNILVNEQKTVVKVCDLGSASDASENDITPYLVSRFYRAPEIIMGVPYDCSLDIWSIGCTLYELYTGKILFPGRSNNQMLLLMMELKGRFNSKMIKKAKFGEHYFDEMGAFESIEKDRVTGSDIIRKVHLAKPARDLRARLLPSASKMDDEETKIILSFIDLLDKCLMLDPGRRITPKDALAHPFIRG